MLSFARAVARRLAELAATLRTGWPRGWRVRRTAAGSPHVPDMPDSSTTGDGPTAPPPETELTSGTTPKLSQPEVHRRRADRPKASDCMWLEIDKLISQGILVPGARRNGMIGWPDYFKCEDIPSSRFREYRCSVTYEAHLEEPATASLWLKFWMRDPTSGNEREVKQRVAVAKRWGAWWFCDHGRWSKRLCQPNNGARFASPQAWGIRFPNPPRNRARMQHPAGHSDPNSPPNASPPGSYETTPIRRPASDRHHPSTNPVANAAQASWLADELPAKSDAKQSASCGRRLDDEHTASSPACVRRWAWFLAKLALVKRAFVGGTDCTRFSPTAARDHRGTGLLRKLGQAKYVAKRCVRQFCQAVVVWPACAVVRLSARIGAPLRKRWKQKGQSTRRPLSR